MTLKANISALFLILVLLGAAWFERRVVRQVRAENQSLRAAVAMRTQLESSDSPPAAIDGSGSKRELAQLRNEVRKLRQQRPELERLRSDNERLVQEIAAKSQPRPAPTPEQGFIMNDTWTNAGLGTPEATLQTFLWALRQQDLQTLVACLSAENLRKSGLIDEQTGHIRPQAVDPKMLALGRVAGYRIAALETSGERAKAELQAAVNGASIRLSLRRVGQEWKLHNL